MSHRSAVHFAAAQRTVVRQPYGSTVIIGGVVHHLAPIGKGKVVHSRRRRLFQFLHLCHCRLPQRLFNGLLVLPFQFLDVSAAYLLALVDLLHHLRCHRAFGCGTQRVFCVGLRVSIANIVARVHSACGHSTAHDAAGDRAANKRRSAIDSKVTRCSCSCFIFRHTLCHILADTLLVCRRPAHNQLIGNKVGKLREHFFAAFHKALLSNFGCQLLKLAAKDSLDIVFLQQIVNRHFLKHRLRSTRKSAAQQCLFIAAATVFGIHSRRRSRTAAKEQRAACAETKTAQRSHHCAVSHAHARLIQERTNFAAKLRFCIVHDPLRHRASRRICLPIQAHCRRVVVEGTVIACALKIGFLPQQIEVSQAASKVKRNRGNGSRHSTCINDAKEVLACRQFFHFLHLLDILVLVDLPHAIINKLCNLFHCVALGKQCVQIALTLCTFVSTNTAKTIRLNVVFCYRVNKPLCAKVKRTKSRFALLAVLDRPCKVVVLLRLGKCRFVHSLAVGVIAAKGTDVILGRSIHRAFKGIDLCLLRVQVKGFQILNVLRRIISFFLLCCDLRSRRYSPLLRHRLPIPAKERTTSAVVTEVRSIVSRRIVNFSCLCIVIGHINRSRRRGFGCIPVFLINLPRLFIVFRNIKHG